MSEFQGQSGDETFGRDYLYGRLLMGCHPDLSFLFVVICMELGDWQGQ